MRDSGEEPDLPEVTACEHLVNYLFEIGPTQSSGMDEAPLSATEIRAWQAGSTIPLGPWEFRTLRVLSREYLQEFRAASEATRPAPYVLVNEETRANLDEKLRGMFRRIAESAEAKGKKRKRS